MKKRLISVALLTILACTLLAAPATNVCSTVRLTNGGSLTYEFKGQKSHLYHPSNAVIEGDSIELRCTLTNTSRTTYHDVYFFLACADGGLDLDEGSLVLTNGNWTTSECEKKPHQDGMHIKSTKFDFAPGEVATLTVSGKIVGSSALLGEKGITDAWVIVRNRDDSEEGSPEASNPELLGADCVQLPVVDKSLLVRLTFLLVCIIAGSIIFAVEAMTIIRLRREYRKHQKTIQKIDIKKPLA